MTYRANVSNYRGWKGREGREGVREMERGREGWEGKRGGMARLGYLSRGPQVPSYATERGAVKTVRFLLFFC